jgi:hypothetical protein
VYVCVYVNVFASFPRCNGGKETRTITHIHTHFHSVESIRDLEHRFAALMPALRVSDPPVVFLLANKVPPFTACCPLISNLWSLVSPLCSLFMLFALMPVMRVSNPPVVFLLADQVSPPLCFSSSLCCSPPGSLLSLICSLISGLCPMHSSMLSPVCYRIRTACLVPAGCSMLSVSLCLCYPLSAVCYLPPALCHLCFCACAACKDHLACSSLQAKSPSYTDDLADDCTRDDGCSADCNLIAYHNNDETPLAHTRICR